MSRSSRVIATGLVVLVLSVMAANLWFWLHPSDTVVSGGPERKQVISAVTSAGPAASKVELELAVKFPVPFRLPPLGMQSKTGIDASLIELFGRRAVLASFQLGDFANRFVATVDNLGRDHAPAGRWPVNPTPGHFTVEHRGGATFIASDNALRYAGFVQLMESAEARSIASTYQSLYPRFQKAFEEQGFPGRNFNDRVVEVIDQLLATPVPSDPIRVRLPEINGPMRPDRPWVLYQIEDSALNSLKAGQRILLRMGPVNERRIKKTLSELRPLLTAGATRK